MKFALLLLTAAAALTTTTAIKCYVCKEGLEPDECKHTTGQQTQCPDNVNTCYVRQISKDSLRPYSHGYFDAQYCDKKIFLSY